MFVNLVQKVILLLVFNCLLCVTALASVSKAPAEETRKLFPDQLGEFRAVGAIRTSADTSGDLMQTMVEEFGVTSAASRWYVPNDGVALSVWIFNCRNEAGAYAFATNYWRPGKENTKVNPEVRYGEIGIASRADDYAMVFVKGSAVVRIYPAIGRVFSDPYIPKLARAVSELVDKGGGEIPVLVKHLPEWEVARQHALYAVSLKTLTEMIPNQPVLDALNFEDGVEAVAANYGSSQLVIVEFNTPQHASDNDARINAKLQELHAQRAAAPSAYRRVGNYSVFVFNAPDEQAASKLIDQVKYEQVVQWLGRNPNVEAAAAAADKNFVDTTLGVFVSVVKASGLAILITLGIGGLFGGVLFRWRRSQRAAEAYSDAGGMLRLNIDELTTPQTDPSKLIGPGH